MSHSVTARQALVWPAANRSSSDRKSPRFDLQAGEGYWERQERAATLQRLAGFYEDRHYRIRAAGFRALLAAATRRSPGEGQ